MVAFQIGRVRRYRRSDLDAFIDRCHRLALVEVDPDGNDTLRYLTDAFAGMEGRIHCAETAVTFDWVKLWGQSSEPM